MPVLRHRGCIEHKYQDSKYGYQMRVATRTSKEGTFRCTVCGNDFTKGSDQYDRRKKK